MTSRRIDRARVLPWLPVRHGILGVAFALAIGHDAVAGVLTVGGAQADFSNIQAAVDAAIDGDVVLVRAGRYQGFTLESKGVTVAADPEGSVLIDGQVRVHQLSAPQRCVLLGLTIRYAGSTSGALECVGNSGSIRGEALVCASTGSSFGTACSLTSSIDVAFARSRFLGADAVPTGAAGVGISESVGSRVALYESSIRGGSGADGALAPATTGALGAFVGASMFGGGSVLSLSGSIVQGGNGGDGTPAMCSSGTSALAGADGAIGIGVSAGGSWIGHAWIEDSEIVGGAGGAGGSGDPTCGAPAAEDGVAGLPFVALGGLSELAGTRRTLFAPSLVREQQSLELSIAGVPGDDAVLLVAESTQWQGHGTLPGVLLVGPGARRVHLGAIPSGGVLHASFPVSDLGPGESARVHHLQAVCTDSNGRARLTGPAVIVVLDSAY